MIILDVEQGTTDWAMARLGIPTASQFDRILTPKTMKPSSQMTAYAHELIAEQLLGEPLDDATSGFMLRGSVMEKKAVSFYELQNDVNTQPIGFILRDDKRVGASPDRFVGNDGLAEVKCPAADTHVGYLLDVEGIGYRCQVQGQLWIAQREWCDTISYNPFMPICIVRQYRDEKLIAALATAVDQFLEYVDELKEQLQARHGLFPEFKRAELRIA